MKVYTMGKIGILLLGGMTGFGPCGFAAGSGVRGANQRHVYAVPTEQALQVQTSGTPVRETPFALSGQGPAVTSQGRSRFEKQVLSTSAEMAAFQRLASGAANELEVPVPGGGSVVVTIDQLIQRGTGTVSFVGKLEGDPLSEVILVWHDGVVSGFLNDFQQKRFYQLRITAQGAAEIREMDETAFTAECGNTRDDPVAESSSQDSTVTASTGIASDIPDPGITITAVTTMDVVVGYGIEARQAEGGVAAIEALIIAAVDRMNTAFANSGITDTELVLLATIEDPDYNYPGITSGDMEEELINLNSHGDGVLDVVSQLRIDLGADLNTFVIKDADGSAGIAYRPGRSAVIARTYMTSTRITFVHELGHNIGCKHAWGDDTDCGTSGSNYGWRLQSGGSKYRTVMAYDWAWLRIPYFSSPNVFYAGVATGHTNGYDATGDTTTDSRFISGGYSGTCTNNTGFDGTHPNLGANNAQYIQDNAQYIEDNAVRTPPPPTAQILPYGQTFSSVLPDSTDGWKYYSSNQGRIQSSSGMLEMDAAVNGGFSSLNEGVLYLDLSGQSGIILEFDHVSYGETDTALPSSFAGHQNGDGVAMSADGSTWYTLVNLSTSFTGMSINLDAAVQTAGIAYSTNFQIKFQQYDNRPIPAEGRGIDNISVDFAPVLSVSSTEVTVAVYAGQTAPPDAVSVVNVGGRVMNYTVATNVDWLSVSPSTGSSTGETDEVVIICDSDSLASGSYAGWVQVSSDDVTNSPQTVTVDLSVYDLPQAVVQGYGELETETVQDWRYILQCRTNMLSGDWVNISTNLGDGNLQTISYSNTLERGYYQIQVLPPE